MGWDDEGGGGGVDYGSSGADGTDADTGSGITWTPTSDGGQALVWSWNDSDLGIESVTVTAVSASVISGYTAVNSAAASVGGWLWSAGEWFVDEAVSEFTGSNITAATGSVAAGALGAGVTSVLLSSTPAS